MKIIKGWKKISHQGGYVNESTGQTVLVKKKDYSSNYHALLFTSQPTHEEKSKTVSPDFSTEAKATAFAIRLMEKHPNGV